MRQYYTMLQFPHPIPSTKFAQLITQIEMMVKTLSYMPISAQTATHIFHQQILKSSLFSARIEGNQLTLIEAGASADRGGAGGATNSRAKREVSNVLRALQRAQHLKPPWQLEQLTELHQLIMAELSADAGHFRQDSSAIFDQHGNVVYLTPSPSEAQAMLAELFTHLNQATQSPGDQLIQAAQSHYYFEKIHPFLDGNGRTGRVLLQTQLQATGLFGEFTIPIDEFFEKNRSEYYYFLEKNTRQLEGFVEFFLRGLTWSLETLLQDIKKSGEAPSTIAAPTSDQPELQTLLPRRQEILAIIHDHPQASLDMIARRFPTIPRRTISHDVQWLVNHHLVIKQGSTRGVRYVGK